jgi:hypothetical protein
MPVFEVGRFLFTLDNRWLRNNKGASFSFRDRVVLSVLGQFHNLHLSFEASITGGGNA